MKTKLILLIALTTLSTITFAQAKDTTPVQKTQRTMYEWQVKIHFDLPDLNPEAIQIGLLDFEPTEKFMQKVHSTYLINQLKKAKDEKEKTFQINAGIEVTWNQLFSAVKGSELYLLTKKVFTLSTMADYANPKTNMWLASKMFYLDGKPYCYTIPLELENGANLEFTLNSTNLISLTDIFNKIKK